MLQLLLFAIYSIDLIYLANFTEVGNFENDKTSHVCVNDLNNFIMRVEHDAILSTEWSENNNMKLINDKSHHLILGHKYENVWVRLEGKKTSREQNRNYLEWK